MYSFLLRHCTNFTVLQRLRQAFDEFACHARMDLKEERAKKMIQDEGYNEKNVAVEEEARRQKAQLLLYMDYVKERHAEVLQGMEESQEEERFKMKQDLNLKSSKCQSAFQRCQPIGAFCW